MSNKCLEIVQIKQILRLHSKGKSYREITNLLGFSRKAVTKYVLLYKSTGLSYESFMEMTEEELGRLMTEQEKVK